MAGKAPKGGSAYKVLKPFRRAPRPKKSYAQKALSKMRTRLSKPPR